MSTEQITPTVTEEVTPSASYEQVMNRIRLNPNPRNVTMTPEETAVYIPLGVGNLAQLRSTGKGPKFLNPTGRTILYRVGDVDDWLEESQRTETKKRTTEEGHAA